MKTAAGLQRFFGTMETPWEPVRYQDQVQGLLGKAGRYSPKRLEFRNPKKTLGCFLWDTSRSRFLPRWICKCKWCCRYGDSRFCLWDCESKTGLHLWCWGHWCHRSLRQCRNVAKYQHLHLQVLTVFWNQAGGLPELRLLVASWENSNKKIQSKICWNPCLAMDSWTYPRGTDWHEVFPNLGDLDGLTMREQKSRYEASAWGFFPFPGCGKYKLGPPLPMVHSSKFAQVFTVFTCYYLDLGWATFFGSLFLL